MSHNGDEIFIGRLKYQKISQSLTSHLLGTHAVIYGGTVPDIESVARIPLVSQAIPPLQVAPDFYWHRDQSNNFPGYGVNFFIKFFTVFAVVKFSRVILELLDQESSFLVVSMIDSRPHRTIARKQNSEFFLTFLNIAWQFSLWILIRKIF